ncbi:hypothetical protein V2J09_020288 [Rumex salicifolius]
MEESSNDDFGFAFNDIDLSDRVVHIETPGKYGTVIVRSLHISSVILAAKSGFFYKLFKKTERKQRDVTLRINQSEKAAFMELLQFMYTKTLSATSCSVLVDVLMAADKFEIKSCVKHCIQLLLEMPMSLDSAILYLDLPLIHSVIKPLIDASKASGEEAINLPLRAMEIVLGSEDLQVDSEYEIFKFILDWGDKHYPQNPIDRTEIITKLLSRFAVHVDFRSPRCVIYFDLRKTECMNLLKKQSIFSEIFTVGGVQFFLMARCYGNEDEFGLVLVKLGSKNCCTVNVDFAVMKNGSEEFESEYNVKNRLLTEEEEVCVRFETPWNTFVCHNSEHFIDEMINSDILVNCLAIEACSVLRMEEYDNFGIVFNDSDFSDRVLHIETKPLSLSAFSEKSRFLPPDNDSDCFVFDPIILHISSAILAARSSFFYKLFKNGMLESHQKDVTLRINQSEKAALLDLLGFMYTKNLSATSSSDLVDVLMAADKFGVNSCIKHCIQLLLEKPMTLESAILYLDLPSTIFDVVEPLINATIPYLIILGRGGFRVGSEYEVFNFVLEWGSKHYRENRKERRAMITELVERFVHFPSMSCSMLRRVLKRDELDRKKAIKLVKKALFLKAELPFGKHINARNRLYKDRLVKVVHLEFRLPRCVVYFDLTKEDCRSLTTKSICSETFLIGGLKFYLRAEYYDEEESLSSSQGFGVDLDILGPEKCKVNVEFALMKRQTDEFQTQHKDKQCTLSDKDYVGFEIPWTTFMRDDSEYFNDEILHLRVDFTLCSWKY